MYSLTNLYNCYHIQVVIDNCLILISLLYDIDKIINNFNISELESTI